MGRTGNIFFMALVVALFSRTPMAFGLETEPSQAQLKSYMETYKAYLRAKISNDPTSEEKLKAYNQAYSEYLKFLRVSIPPRKPAESAVSPEAQKPVATLIPAGSETTNLQQGMPASESVTSPAISAATGTTGSNISVGTATFILPEQGAATTTP